MLARLFDATIRFFGGYDERDPWYGSKGTFAELFKKELEEVATMCGWRTEGASATFNRETKHVEFRSTGGELLATIFMRGSLDTLDSAVVYSHSLTLREMEALQRRLPIPITFTGKVS